MLDLHLFWHPNDASAEAIASEIEDHFQRQRCAGLHAGAIEVFRRSLPWNGQPGSPPRPIPLPTEREIDAALSLHGRMRCLDRDGQVIDMATASTSTGKPRRVCCWGASGPAIPATRQGCWKRRSWR